VGPPSVDSLSLALAGPRRVKEGKLASGFKVKLAEGSLASGDSVTLTLRARSATAQAKKDFDPLTARRLKPGAGVSFAARDELADGLIRVTATNVSGADLAANSVLARFAIRARQDSKKESLEDFKVQLSSQDASVSKAQWRTSIVDDDGVSPGPSPSTPSNSVPFTPARLPAGTFGDNFDFGRLRFDNF
jgi:hypothetical protein